MKNFSRARIVQIFGIIALAVVIGLTGCASAPSAGTSTGTGSRTGSGVGSITITDIPAAYNGKFSMLLADRSDTTQGWGMLTISGTSATFNILDWVTDRPTTISAGNYSVTLVIADNVTAAANDNYLYAGVILDKALSGQTVTVGFSEFISATSSSSSSSSSSSNSRITELQLATQFSGTIEYGQTLQFRVYLGNDSFYEIEWDDNDRTHSGPLQNAADVRVGVRREGASNYIIPIADQGNHGDTFSNTHRIHRDTPPRYEANNWYIIEVEATYAGGNFRINVW